MNKTEKLEKRLKDFALQVLKLVKILPKTEENRIYGHQLIRSSSSVGANYAEARYAHSRQDFIHTINICRKESNESLYWLKMLSEVNSSFLKEFLNLIDESRQILKIFISSVKTTKENQRNEKQ